MGKLRQARVRDLPEMTPQVTDGAQTGAPVSRFQQQPPSLGIANAAGDEQEIISSVPSIPWKIAAAV